METPGFKLGRTDPNIDPQGRDFIYMLELAPVPLPPAVGHGRQDPRHPGSAPPKSPQIYAESSLDATLQSGQLDASSAFVTQAIELHLDYIPLPPAINLGDVVDGRAVHAKASVTLTNGGRRRPSTARRRSSTSPSIGKPTPAGTAFVKYTLSPTGLAQYKQGGFTLLTPTVFGDSSAVPAAIKSELGS